MVSLTNHHHGTEKWVQSERTETLIPTQQIMSIKQFYVISFQTFKNFAALLVIYLMIKKVMLVVILELKGEVIQ